MRLLLLALACGGPPSEAPAYVLDAPPYRFCHEAGFRKGEAQAWCALVDEIPPERCPGLHETCANPDIEESHGCADGSGGEEIGHAPAAGPDRPMSCDAPAFGDLRGLVKWFSAIGVASVILVLSRILLAYFGRTPASPIPRGAGVDAPPPDDALPDVPDLPSDDLLTRAQSALEAGRFGEAVVLARGAALRRLGERGVVTLHRARTDREYVRQARRDAAAAEGEALAVVVRAAEAHRFGGWAVDADHAGAALAAARRIVTGAMLALVAADARAQASRHGPFGDAALFELFETYGHTVSWLGVPLADVGADADVLVLDLDAVAPDPADWTALRGWVEAGGVLVVGGDATDGFPELGRYEVLDAGGATSLAPELEPYLAAPPRWPGGAAQVWAGGVGMGWVFAQRDPVPSPVVTVADVGSGAVVGIADGLLLTNGALIHPDNERFLGELVQVGQGPLGWPVPLPARVVLATRSATPQEGPPAAAANPRLLPFVVQLLGTWLLAGVWLGWPFAVPRDPPGEGRQRFLDHVTALGTRYMRLGATGHARAVVSRYWLGRLGATGLELAARRAGYDASAARDLVADTEAAAVGAADGPNDLDKVEELWRVTRGR